VVVSKAYLAVAGLNQHLQVGNAACVWEHGTRSVLLGAVEGFGTSWTGTLRENPEVSADGQAHWSFHLHGGALDAAEIDRWVGPRARPSWLRSLLDSLGGAENKGGPPNAGDEPAPSAAISASGLIRQVDAQGDVSLDALTVENLRLENVRATGRLHGLQVDVSDVSAQWAGGKVRGKLNAKFAPRPVYEVTAQLEGVNLARLPEMPNISERLGGAASGNVHLTTEGVGRTELLQNLAGQGKVTLREVEFRGWDVEASVVDGAARAGVSRWARGTGAFTLAHRALQIEPLRLEDGRQLTLVRGSIDFAQRADFSIQTTDAEHLTSAGPPASKNAPGKSLKVSGPLNALQVTVDAALARDAASTANP